MKIRTVTSLRHFDELGSLWREVIEHGGQSSVLTSHEWFACCWRTAGPSRTRELWIIEDAASPLALIPLVRTKRRYRGFPTRVLQLMHPPEVPIISFPVGRDVDEVMAAFVERLCADDDWDLLLLPGLPADTPVWKAFEAAAATRFPLRVAERAEVASVLLSARDPYIRGALKRLHDDIALSDTPPRGTILVEEHRAVDVRGPLFQDVMDIVQTRTSRPASPRAASCEEVRRFFRELTTRASLNGWLSLWVLRLDGRVIEAEYQLQANGSVHALRRDADRSPAELRAGDRLTLAIFEGLLAQPAAQIYHRPPMLSATDPVPASSFQETLSVEAFAPRPYARLLHHVESRVLPLARRFGGSARQRPCA